MSEEDAAPLDRSISEPESLSTQRWVRRGVVILVAIVVAFVFFRITAAFLPRWWAQRVADQVDGGFAAGTVWGLFYGFAFTFVPLVLLFQTRRKLFSWKAKIVLALLAAVLAAPNWLTLSVVAGNSNAAHAGERIFDVYAPGFRWATLIGVGMGALMAVLLLGTSIAMSRRRKQVKQLKEQVKNQRHDQTQSPKDGAED